MTAAGRWCSSLGFQHSRFSQPPASSRHVLINVPAVSTMHAPPLAIPRAVVVAAVNLTPHSSSFRLLSTPLLLLGPHLLLPLWLPLPLPLAPCQPMPAIHGGPNIHSSAGVDAASCCCCRAPPCQPTIQAGLQDSSHGTCCCAPGHVHDSNQPGPAIKQGTVCEVNCAVEQQAHEGPLRKRAGGEGCRGREGKGDACRDRSRTAKSRQWMQEQQEEGDRW